MNTSKLADDIASMSLIGLAYGMGRTVLAERIRGMIDHAVTQEQEEGAAHVARMAREMRELSPMHNAGVYTPISRAEVDSYLRSSGAKTLRFVGGPWSGRRKTVSPHQRTLEVPSWDESTSNGIVRHTYRRGYSVTTGEPLFIHSSIPVQNECFISDFRLLA